MNYNHSSNYVRIIVPLLLAAGYFTSSNAKNENLTSIRYTDPYPAQWIDDSGLTTTGFGSVNFTARDGNQLSALVYRSTGFDPHNGTIWFVMHGASRAVERYINTAAPVAERHNALAIAIHFPKSDYPASRDYTLGVTNWGRPNARALKETRWRQPDDYLYAEIEHVFEAVRQSLNGEQQGYLLFGHSAGAQFTHRLMAFRPDARVLGAVAANAGWYTLPLSGSGSSYSMPYGLGETPLDEADLRAYLASPLSILVGERDTTTPATNKMVRGTREAMLQGRSRRARGEYFYAMGQSRAQALGTPFNWRFAMVPDAKHSAAQVIGSAAFYLFEPDESPCMPSKARNASGLVVTEILADPPRGLQGDANGDGLRNPLEDEFIELVNTGSTAICLAGWQIGDASNAKRHVFPLGRALEPDQAIIIFGGGVPTGGFGGAVVQWAMGSNQLNLNNEGDVVTLRDASGDIVKQISWGDCGGVRCAAEHLSYKLGKSTSVVRWPEPDGEWAIHADISDTRFSPGLKTSGTGWQTKELN